MIPTVKVLLAEDDRKISSFVKKGFAQEGYTVEVVSDGEDALVHARSGEYDVIILDIMLPHMDGWQVLDGLRGGGLKTPVVILSARGHLEDRVRGLNLGADDYLAKPFSFTELLARVRAVVRRSQGQPAPRLLVGDVTLDPASRVVTRAGQRVELTAREYSLLEYLMRNADRVVTRTSILEHVWGLSFDSFSNVVEVYVNYLRKKVDPEKRLIHAVRGVGYVMREEA